MGNDGKQGSRCWIGPGERRAGRVAIGGGGQEGQGVGRSRKLSQPNPCLMVGEAVGGVGSHPNFLLSPLNKRRRDALEIPLNGFTPGEEQERQRQEGLTRQAS